MGILFVLIVVLFVIQIRKGDKIFREHDEKMEKLKRSLLV